MTLNMAEAKSALRARVLGQRDALDEAIRAAHSAKIAEHWIEAIQIPSGAMLSGFLPIKSEVNVRPILDAMRARGHGIALPVVQKPRMFFRQWQDGMPLIPAGFGTEGPAADAPEVIPDAMIVPLSAFDTVGRRMGYGKGYYDTAIQLYSSLNRRPLLIGVAFACQEVNEVPTEDHDQTLDAIVTEAGVLDLTGRATCAAGPTKYL